MCVSEGDVPLGNIAADFSKEPRNAEVVFVQDHPIKGCLEPEGARISRGIGKVHEERAVMAGWASFVPFRVQGARDGDRSMDQDKKIDVRRCAARASRCGSEKDDAGHTVTEGGEDRLHKVSLWFT